MSKNLLNLLGLLLTKCLAMILLSGGIYAQSAAKGFQGKKLARVKSNSWSMIKPMSQAERVLRMTAREYRVPEDWLVAICRYL